MGTDAPPMLSKLATLRQRAFLVLAVRYVVMLTAGTTLAGLGVKGAAVAILIGGLVAAVRCPDLRTVARQTDRTLGLEERLRTAFEWREGRDDVSQLLLQDAARAIQGIRPGDVYPFRIFPGGRTVVWAVPVVAAFFAAQIWMSYVGRSLVLPLKWSPSGVGGVPDVASTQALEENQADAEPLLDGRTDDRETRGEAPPPPAPYADLASSERGSVTEGASPGNEPAPVSASRERTPGSEAFDLDEASPLQKPNRPREPVGQTPSSLEPGTGGAAVASSSDARRTASGSALAGGQSEGPPALSPEPMTADTIDWAAVEAGISRIHVPPGLRNYVRDYFRAIRSRK